MVKQNAIKVFEEKKVRTLWDSETEEWYFSIVDVVAVLTDSENPRRYWSNLKRKLAKEGSQLYEGIVQLKMLSSDGKYYKTDVATTQQLFRLIQSIPSPKAEPFKLWMAQVAAERLDQMQDPELSIEQAMKDYKRLGYSDNWINQRLKSIEIRKELTDEWKKHGLQESISPFVLYTEQKHGKFVQRAKQISIKIVQQAKQMAYFERSCKPAFTSFTGR